MRKKILSLSAIVALGIGLSGCGGGGSTSSAPSVVKDIASLSFAPVSIAKNDTEKKEMRVSPSLTVKYNDGSEKTYTLNYKVLARMGDTIGNGKIGLMVDKDGNPILKADGSEYISDNPDGNSFITVGNKHYLITHMEERPGLLYKTEVILQNNELIPIDTQPLNLKSIGGTIINCASSHTAYGSHLGGEEDYSLNSRYADKNSPFYIDCEQQDNIFTGNDISGKFNYFCSYVAGMQKYLKDYAIDKNNGYNGEVFTPYNYGYIVEAQPLADGSIRVAKHYVTGKYTPELALMMPDGKTVYMTDDGTAKGFYRFVSDKKITNFTPNWEGTLYAAKVKQLSSENGGEFELSWVELGHAKDSEIKALVDKKMKITDIFEIKKPEENGSCPAGFKKVFEDSDVECLKLKPGQEKAAAFLETRKYAAYKGATIEFRKEEGLTYDKDKNVLYVAMSAVEKSMEDNYKGIEPVNDIKLPKNKCGAVYEVTLDSNYTSTKMRAVVVGKPLKEGEKYADEYYCHPDYIANPDNIKYAGHHTLLIGEDTKYHVNNYLWAYNTQTGTMTRIASLPIGAEVTGLEKGFIGDKGLLFINQQHPFKDNPKNAKGEKPNSYLIEKATEEDFKAKIGYVDGVPSDIFK
jgi:secreted PhoX family phosphatase